MPNPNINTAAIHPTSYSGTLTIGRTLATRFDDVVNVLDFSNVDPTGATDSAGGINNAIAAAGSHGSTLNSKKGGVVFFPPGTYKINSPLTCTPFDTWVSLVGSGRENSTIFGNFSGYLINSDGLNNGTSGIISSLQELSIINNYITTFGPHAGAVLMNAVSWNLMIERCIIGGVTGVLASPYGFNIKISDCNFSCPAPVNGTSGTVGFYGAQAAIYNSTITGYDWAVAFSNAGNIGSNTRTESCNIGWMLGKAVYNYPTTAQTNAGSTTITCSSLANVHNGFLVYNQTNPSSITAGTTVGEPSGGTATLSVGAASTINIGDMLFFLGDKTASGVSITGGSTERCNTSIYIYGGSGVNIDGMALTGADAVVHADGATCTYGIRFGTADHVTVSGTTSGGSHSTADFGFNGANVDHITMIGCKSLNGTQLVTNGTTAINTNVLHFSNTIGVFNGSVCRVKDLTNPTFIPDPTTVTGVTATTVTLNNNVTSQINPGELIAFDLPGIDLSGISVGPRATNVTLIDTSSTNLGGTSINWVMPNQSQEAIQFINCNNPTPSLVLGNGANNTIIVPGGIIHITGPTGAFSIGGIKAPASGQTVTLFNTTTQAMTIKNADGAQAAADQILTMKGVDLSATTSNSIFTLIYDTVQAKWLVTSAHDSAGPL